jgi:ankyrin repeat protein
MSEPLSKEAFEELMQDIRGGRINPIQVAITQRPELVKRHGIYSGTMLHEASRCGYINLVNFLLDNGADPNALNLYNSTPLMNASYNGHCSIVTILLQKGADPNIIGNGQTSALEKASRHGYLTICKILVSKGASMFIDGVCVLKNYSNYSMLSTKQKDIERNIIRKNFAEGPHPDARWARRWPLLNVMVGCGYRPTRRMLLELINNKSPFDFGSKVMSKKEWIQYRKGLVFSNDGLLRLIVSFL